MANFTLLRGAGRKHPRSCCALLAPRNNPGSNCKSQKIETPEEEDETERALATKKGGGVSSLGV